MSTIIWIAKFWLLGSAVAFTIVCLFGLYTLMRKWLIWMTISPEWIKKQVGLVEKRLNIKVHKVQEFRDEAGYNYIGCVFESLNKNEPGSGVCYIARFQHPKDMLKSFVFGVVKSIMPSLILSWVYAGMLIVGIYNPNLFQEKK